MPVLNHADSLHLGARPVDSVRLGSALVWPAPTLVPPSNPKETFLQLAGIGGAMTADLVPVADATQIVMLHGALRLGRMSRPTPRETWTFSISDTLGLTWTQVASTLTEAQPGFPSGSVLFVSSPTIDNQPGQLTVTCSAALPIHAMQISGYEVTGAGGIGEHGSTPSQAGSNNNIQCDLSGPPSGSSLVVGTIGNFAGSAQFTPPPGWTAFQIWRYGWSNEMFSYKNSDAAQSNVWRDDWALADSIACVEILGRLETTREEQTA